MNRPGQSINTGVQLCTNDCVLVMSGHTQIININFNTIKEQLNKHKAVLENKFLCLEVKKLLQVIFGQTSPIKWKLTCSLKSRMTLST